MQSKLDNLLEKLNEKQREAVDAAKNGGQVLVLAGAGTGKTTVLISCVASIVVSPPKLAEPWQVLAVTFTNKAANEMKSRTIDTVGVALDWCGTFHSVCLKILRRHAEKLGFPRDFLIAGEDEQKSALKAVFADLKYDTKTYNPSDWVERISAIKDKGLKHRVEGVNQKIYDAYNAELFRRKAVDFGDIILKTLELFDAHPDVLKYYQHQFKYVLVDEFQDANNAQMQLVTLLADYHKNICCVGDDDQSIYSWRGAEIKHILNFNKTYPDAKIIRLETNYRSTSNILGAANSLIRNNIGRLGKDLHAAADAGSGEKVYSITLPTDWDEARMIATSILHHSNGDNYADFAVLLRAGSLSRLLEEEFAEKAIPYRLIGAQKFYDRMEIKDVIAYVRLLVYPFDDFSFMRIVGKPSRKFGPTAIAKLANYGEHFMPALRVAPLSGKQHETMNAFLAAFDFDWDSMAPIDAVQKLLDDSGYLKMWQDSKEPEAPDRLDNIKELLTNVISKYDNLSEFLEHAALMMTDDNDAEEDPNAKNAVNIMTIHAAKGLEFETVFLPAWEEGVFPNEMAVTEGSLEEERRLAYVAITRAKKRAVISNTQSRMVFGQRKFNAPSRFIGEINPDYVSVQGNESYARPKPQMPTSYKPVMQRTKPKRSASIVGKLASHSELGRGVVIEDGGDIITVAFRDKGIKKVAREFLRIGEI